MYRLFCTVIIIFTAVIISCGLQCGRRPEGIQPPGVQPDGSVLLTNGWRLTPAGEQVTVGEFPLGMALSPDGGYLAVTNNGYTGHSVSIIDVQDKKETWRIPVESGWLGICFSPDGGRLFVSGGSSNNIEVYSFDNGAVKHEKTLSPSQSPDKTYFPAGLTVSRDGRLLIAANLLDNSITVFNLTENAPPRNIPVGEMPYAVLIHPDNRRAYVSNWGGKSVSVVDLQQSREIMKIPAGSHPNALVLSPDGKRLYVANANSDNVTVINTELHTVEEIIDMSPYPEAPAGTQPNALALTNDGTILYSANAGNNSIAVIDVSRSPAQVIGLIPTGRYPTAAALTHDNSTLIIANGMGYGCASRQENLQSAQTLTSNVQPVYGTISFIDIPDERQLAEYTKQVIKNNGFKNMPEKLDYGNSFRQPQAVPRKLGEMSLIHYVFYIIKGNMSYDRVFGDIQTGEGDSSLTIFGHAVTPNHHALAGEFVLFDNFYAASEYGALGQEWSAAAIATDFVEKLAPVYYFNRGFPYPSEGNFTTAFPDAGYLWDAAARNGITYRSYGIYVDFGSDRSLPVTTNMENLQGHIASDYPPFDLNIKDVDRAAVFINELNNYVAGDSLPQLNIIRLANDYTTSEPQGSTTQEALAADNDRALGMIVEAISHSPIWEESAVFVIESSSSGSDHIHPRRAAALAISPYVKRGYVDHTLYDTSSIIRTIGLILSLPPLSQFDAAATPLYACFQDAADLKPYKAK